MAVQRRLNRCQAMILLLLTEMTWVLSVGVQSLYACENSLLTISCLSVSANSIIQIINATYGRLTTTKCNSYLGVIISTACTSNTPLPIVGGRCNGQTGCSVNATNSIFGDPCYGTTKYLEVDYQCLQDRIVVETTSAGSSTDGRTQTSRTPSRYPTLSTSGRNANFTTTLNLKENNDATGSPSYIGYAVAVPVAVVIVIIFVVIILVLRLRIRRQRSSQGNSSNERNDYDNSNTADANHYEQLGNRRNEQNIYDKIQRQENENNKQYYNLS